MSRAAPRLHCQGTDRGTMWNGMDAYLDPNEADIKDCSIVKHKFWILFHHVAAQVTRPSSARLQNMRKTEMGKRKTYLP